MNSNNYKIIYGRMCEISDELAVQGVCEAADVSSKLKQTEPADIFDIVCAYGFTESAKQLDPDEEIDAEVVMGPDPAWQRKYLTYAVFAMANMRIAKGETSDAAKRRLQGCWQIIDAAGKVLPLETYSRLKKVARHELTNGGDAPIEP